MLKLPRGMGLLLLLVVASASCASASYRIPGVEMQRLAALPPHLRGESVRVVPIDPSTEALGIVATPQPRPTPAPALPPVETPPTDPVTPEPPLPQAADQNPPVAIDAEMDPARVDSTAFEQPTSPELIIEPRILIQAETGAPLPVATSPPPFVPQPLPSAPGTEVVAPAVRGAPPLGTPGPRPHARAGALAPPARSSSWSGGGTVLPRRSSSTGTVFAAPTRGSPAATGSLRAAPSFVSSFPARSVPMARGTFSSPPTRSMASTARVAPRMGQAASTSMKSRATPAASRPSGSSTSPGIRGGSGGGGGSGGDALGGAAGPLIAFVAIIAIVGIIAAIAASAEPAEPFDGWVAMPADQRLQLRYEHNLLRTVTLRDLRLTDLSGLRDTVVYDNAGVVTRLRAATRSATAR